MKIHWGNPQIQPSPSPSKRRLLSVKACCATFSAAVGEPRSSSTCDRRSNVWTSFSLEPMLGYLFSHHRLYYFYIYISVIIQLSITQIFDGYLVGGIPTPLKNMSSSVGMMTFPRYGKIQHVPNHQSEIFYVCVYIYTVCHMGIK